MAKKVKKVAKEEKKESSTLNLYEFAKNIAENAGVSTAQAKNVLSEYFEAVQSTVTSGGLSPGDKITMPGLGHLVCLQKKPRNARNPKTGESLKIPARPAVKFKLNGLLRIWGKPKKEEKKKAKKK